MPALLEISSFTISCSLSVLRHLLNKNSNFLKYPVFVGGNTNNNTEAMKVLQKEVPDLSISGYPCLSISSSTSILEDLRGLGAHRKSPCSCSTNV